LPTGIKPAVDVALICGQGSILHTVGQGIRQTAAIAYQTVVCPGENSKWTAGPKIGHTADAPSSKNVRRWPFHEIGFTFPKRHFVNVAGHPAMAVIEIAAATLLAQISRVLHETVGASAEQVLLGIVDRLRVGVGTVDGEPAAEALLDRRFPPW
jgi:hypothetical protein